MKTKVITKAHIAEQIRAFRLLNSKELSKEKPRQEFIKGNMQSIKWYKSLIPTN